MNPNNYNDYTPNDVKGCNPDPIYWLYFFLVCAFIAFVLYLAKMQKEDNYKPYKPERIENLNVDKKAKA